VFKSTVFALKPFIGRLFGQILTDGSKEEGRDPSSEEKKEQG